MIPLIGITCSNADDGPPGGAYQSARLYAGAVAAAGGAPVLLPHEVELAPTYVDRCDGFVLTGGDDIDVRVYEQPLHLKAKLIDPRRQAFEMALLEALARRRPDSPCLGVCLGMQHMALAAGGRLDQYLPETLGEEAAARHQANRRHGLTFMVRDSIAPPAEGQVVSSHRQAVADAGSLRVVATAEDGVIEAVDDPARRFYLGVQWHPERALEDANGGARLNRGLFAALIDSARSAR